MFQNEYWCQTRKKSQAKNTFLLGSIIKRPIFIHSPSVLWWFRMHKNKYIIYVVLEHKFLLLLKKYKKAVTQSYKIRNFIWQKPTNKWEKGSYFLWELGLSLILFFALLSLAKLSSCQTKCVCCFGSPLLRRN